MEYITVREAASKWGISIRHTQEMCINGKVKGAVKFGRDWAIPNDCLRPIDERITSGRYTNRKQVNWNTTSEPISYLCKNDKKLEIVISQIGDLRYNLHLDYYAFLVTTIVGQQLSNKAAQKINERLNKECGNKITIKSISSLSDDKLNEIGIGRNKIKYIRDLTDKVNSCKINFSHLNKCSDEKIMFELNHIKGIGNWTAKMYLIFALNRLDVLPYEDGAFLQAYKWLYNTDDLKTETIINNCEKWKPYSSIAARYLYKALDSGLTKTNINLLIEGKNNE